MVNFGFCVCLPPVRKVTLVITAGNVLWISDYKMFLSNTASFKKLLRQNKP